MKVERDKLRQESSTNISKKLSSSPSSAFSKVVEVAVLHDFHWLQQMPVCLEEQRDWQADCCKVYVGTAEFLAL